MAILQTRHQPPKRYPRKAAAAREAAQRKARDENGRFTVPASNGYPAAGYVPRPPMPRYPAACVGAYSDYIDATIDAARRDAAADIELRLLKVAFFVVVLSIAVCAIVLEIHPK